eukprot:m.443437 g.443437  ORF g.443437 m.443437 type:complete len:65 (-) comp18963_c0_seq1:1104-1298(-)
MRLDGSYQMSRKFETFWLDFLMMRLAASRILSVLEKSLDAFSEVDGMGSTTSIVVSGSLQNAAC